MLQLFLDIRAAIKNKREFLTIFHVSNICRSLFTSNYVSNLFLSQCIRPTGFYFYFDSKNLKTGGFVSGYSRAFFDYFNTVWNFWAFRGVILFISRFISYHYIIRSNKRTPPNQNVGFPKKCTDFIGRRRVTWFFGKEY